MSFSYQVILRPSDVRFSEKNIPDKFNNGNKLIDLKNDVANGKTLAKDVPPIQVVWLCEKWEWYTLSNRRLWVFKQLENDGHLSYVAMDRVEMVEDDYVYPQNLHKVAILYTPDWDIRTTNNNLKLNSQTGSSIAKDVLHFNSAGQLAKELGAVQIKDRNVFEMLSSADDDFNSAGQLSKDLGAVLINDRNVFEMLSADETMECLAEQVDDWLVSSESEELTLCDEDVLLSEVSETSDKIKTTSRIDEMLKVDKDVDTPNVIQRDETKKVTHQLEREDIDILEKKEKKNYKKQFIDRETKSREKNCIQGETSLKIDKLLSVCKKSSSCVSLASTKSLSSISPNERVISRSSGLYGYGYFHSYKTEYLDKLKHSRKKALKRYKPYDVDKGQHSRSLKSSRCSSFPSLSNWKSSDKFSRSPSSLNISAYHEPNSNFDTPQHCLQIDSKRSEEMREHRSTKLRMRLYSDDMGYDSRDHGRDTNRKRSQSREWDLGKSDHSQYRDKDRTAFNSRILRRYSESDGFDLVPYKQSSTYSSCKSLSSIGDQKVVSSGVKFALLYKIWEKRRAEYLSASKDGESASLPPYICGLCFKRFIHIVDLQQHSEELLHYACITCGKFFSSYAALGQHSKQLGHKKD